ncbi:PAS domain S-box-containing protein [Cnuella takakiae]|uniref:PAS domain S-box-containing protein n=2 Tax=Cnuella takakiae TaxID=1302690 RepID=A0A1M5DTB0_9BACT|nr:PAS domain S-box-containing protein [Cnuella takakiae]
MHLDKERKEPQDCLLLVLDTAFSVHHINRYGAALLGYEVHEIIGKNWFDHFLPHEEGCHLKSLFQKLVPTDPHKLEHFENAVLCKDGSYCLVKWHNKLIHNAAGAWVGSSSKGYLLPDTQQVLNPPAREQIAYRKRATEAFIETQEKERALIAEILHEHVGQLLTSCHLLIEGEQRDRQSPSLAIATNYLRQGIDQLRNLSHQLSAQPLQVHGFANATRQMIKDLTAGKTLKVAFHIEGKQHLKQLSADVQLHLFRIIQEQVTNIRQHARANQATVSLTITRHLAELNITDDGQGFDLDSRSISFGLLGMQSRAENLGGLLRIKTAPGAGCSLQVMIPLDSL